VFPAARRMLPEGDPWRCVSRPPTSRSTCSRPGWKPPRPARPTTPPCSNAHPRSSTKTSAARRTSCCRGCSSCCPRRSCGRWAGGGHSCGGSPPPGRIRWCRGVRPASAVGVAVDGARSRARPAVVARRDQVGAVERVACQGRQSLGRGRRCGRAVPAAAALRARSDPPVRFETRGAGPPAGSSARAMAPPEVTVARRAAQRECERPGHCDGADLAEVVVELPAHRLAAGVGVVDKARNAVPAPGRPATPDHCGHCSNGRCAAEQVVHAYRPPPGWRRR
jgi:hypothetical protein